MRCLLLVPLLALAAWAAPALESYNIAEGSVTVSGISSGGCMSTQMHVAFSSTVKGAAFFAGVVYYCARGLSTTAVTVCMPYPGLVDVDALISKVYDYQDSNAVDSSVNLLNSKVFIWQGTEDTVVDPGNADNFVTFYSHFGASIQTVTNVPSGHGQPTEDYGNTCATSEDPYINKCSYDGAYQALNYLYGGLTAPSSGSYTGQLLEYDQTEFSTKASLDSNGGYVYVPTACASGSSCKLHMVFHGCLQGREFLGDEFVVNTGYLQVADANNIVLLFPQIVKSLSNPNGCWDWWGYDGLNYANKNGPQMSAMKAMIDRASGN